MEQEIRTELKLVQLIGGVDRRHRRAIEAQIDRLGIHRAQHMILMYLARQEEAPTQRRIAEAFDYTPAAVTITLNRMEELGLIRRVVHSGDARAKKVYLTDRGREVVDTSRKCFREIDDAMFRGLAPADLAALTAVLEILRDNLSGYAEESDDLRASARGRKD